MPDVCTYCGEVDGIEREHVIPAMYYSMRSFDPTKQWIVPACPICNMLAGGSLFFSIPAKARYISKRYRSRYKRALSVASWTPEELNGLSYSLRSGMENAMLAKIIVLRRIRHLETVSEYAADYLRPKWVEDAYREFQQQIRKVKKPKPTSSRSSRATSYKRPKKTPPTYKDGQPDTAESSTE